MEDIPRHALIVRPKQALMDWVNAVTPDFPMTLNSDENDESTVYLIPTFFAIEDALTWLRKNFKPILEEELDGWCTDPQHLPPLTWKTFDSFLYYRIHSMVIDVAQPQTARKPATRVQNNLKTKPGSKNKSPDVALELEISLEDITPKIWRTVLIATDNDFFISETTFEAGCS